MQGVALGEAFIDMTDVGGYICVVGGLNHRIFLYLDFFSAWFWVEIQVVIIAAFSEGFFVRWCCGVKGALVRRVVGQSSVDCSR